MLNSPIYGNYDGNAFNVMKAMNRPPSAARAAVINTLVTSLKSAGVWQKLDLLYILGAHANQAGRVNWINPDANQLTNNGSTTFTVDRGFTGDGATGYLAATTGMNALTQFTQNSAHISFWSLSDAANNNNFTVGVNQGVNSCRFNPRNAAGNTTGHLNSAGSEVHAVADSLGHFLMNRTGSAATEQFKNAVSIGTDTDVSTTPPTGAFVILANRPNNTGIFSNLQVMAASAGAGLTAGEVTSFHNALNTYKTAIGA